MVQIEGLPGGRHGSYEASKFKRIKRWILECLNLICRENFAKLAKWPLNCAESRRLALATVELCRGERGNEYANTS